MAFVDPLTIDDFEKLPDALALNHELVDGKLVDEERRVQPFVPDLAIEIVSPNDTFARLTQKADRYRKNGTQEVWIFDIDFRRAFLFSERGDAILNENQQFSSPLLPGLSVPIRDIFDRR
jgi:Uma2 family endonuclease